MVLGVSVLVAVGCGDGSNPGNSGGDGNNGNIDSKLVGDWLVVSDNQDAEFISFSASGEYYSGGWGNLGDFWIEILTMQGQLSTENGNLYAYEVIDGKEYKELVGPYTISDNTLTLHDGGTVLTLTKFNITNHRSSLGTVYTQDHRLYGYWQLSGTSNIQMYFAYYGNIRSNDWQRYWGAEDIDEDAVLWYTVGSNLFLLTLGCSEFDPHYLNRCVSIFVTETLELRYNLTGRGESKTLTLRLVNPNGTLGPADVWESGSRNYSLSKSTQSRHLIRTGGGSLFSK